MLRVVGDDGQAVEPRGGGDDAIRDADPLAARAQLAHDLGGFTQHRLVHRQNGEALQIGRGGQIGGEAGGEFQLANPAGEKAGAAVDLHPLQRLRAAEALFATLGLVTK